MLKSNAEKLSSASDCLKGVVVPNKKYLSKFSATELKKLLLRTPFLAFILSMQAP